MGNQTNVSTGVIGGSIMLIAWWIFGEMTSIVVPEVVIAASVTLATAILQFIAPTMNQTPKDDYSLEKDFRNDDDDQSGV